MQSHGEGAHEQPKWPPPCERATEMTAGRQRLGVGDVVVAATGHALDGTAQRMAAHPEPTQVLVVRNATAANVRGASDSAEVRVQSQAFHRAVG